MAGASRFPGFWWLVGALASFSGVVPDGVGVGGEEKVESGGKASLGRRGFRRNGGSWLVCAAFFLECNENLGCNLCISGGIGGRRCCWGWWVVVMGWERR